MMHCFDEIINRSEGCIFLESLYRPTLTEKKQFCNAIYNLQFTMHLQTISGCSVNTSYKISKMRANLLQIYLYPASIQYFMLCFVQRFHEHSK